MRILILATVLLALLVPGSAIAAGSPDTGAAPATPSIANSTPDVGLPLARPQALTTRPPGFSSTAEQAMSAAKGSPEIQSIHRRQHPLTVLPLIWRAQSWVVDFAFHGKIIIEAEVSATGRLGRVYTGPLASTHYARGHYAPIFDSPWVVIPFTLLFLVPFIPWARRRRGQGLTAWGRRAASRALDALLVLSLLVSYWLFNHGHLETAVWLVYPPLLLLAARMTRGGARDSAGAREAVTLSLRVLIGGLLVLVAARTALSLLDHKVIDVGYASVIGAHRLSHGQSLYYAAIAHPDTYGPIAYLAYVPFELVWPWHGKWDYLAAAHAASLCFDLVTIGGLVLLGRRLRAGRAGLTLGLGLGWAWAACPFTLLGLMEHSNDGLVAMLSVLALLAFSSAAARGAILGLATAAKFSPAALLPLFAGRRERGWRSGLACAGAFVLVVAAAVALYLPPGGLTEFWNHTLGFQLNRVDVFSPWALHPGLASLKVGAEVAIVLFVAWTGWQRRARALVDVCALATAATIAVQLVAVHWFYYYVIWFLPFLLVAVLAPRAGARELRPPLAPESLPLEVAAVEGREPALVGA